MGVLEYGTGTEIWEAALEDIPFDASSSHPGPSRRIRLLNSGLVEAQKRTGHFKYRETVSFEDGTAIDTYYEITGTSPTVFKLLSATIANEEMEIVDYKTLLSYREGTAVLGAGVFVFAVNLYPGTTVGTVRIEMYPDAPVIAMDVEFFYETVPTAVTALSDTVYMPRDIMEAYVAWRIARSVKPEKSQPFRAIFEGLCATDRAVGAVAKRAQYAIHSGFIESVAGMS
jgi:hypothetical protein